MSLSSSILSEFDDRDRVCGNRGVNLYTPQININQRDIDTISNLTANNVNPTADVADPLGRTPLLGDEGDPNTGRKLVFPVHGL